MPMMFPNNFREGLSTALRGELEAIQMYTRMAEIAPNPIIAQRIRYIAQDEEYHSNILLGMMTMPPQQQAATEAAALAADAFMNMVMDAYRDEVQAAMFYDHLSLMTPNLAVAIRLRDIARDEMVHAEYWAALMTARGVQPPVI